MDIRYLTTGAGIALVWPWKEETRSPGQQPRERIGRQNRKRKESESPPEGGSYMCWGAVQEVPPSLLRRRQGPVRRSVTVVVTACARKAAGSGPKEDMLISWHRQMCRLRGGEASRGCSVVVNEMKLGEKCVSRDPFRQGFCSQWSSGSGCRTSCGCDFIAGPISGERLGGGGEEKKASPTEPRGGWDTN